MPPQKNIVVASNPMHQPSSNFTSLARQYLFHWPLFLVSLTLSALALTYYLKTAKPIYEVKATLLVKDDVKSPGPNSPLHEIDLVKMPRSVDNELEILRSNRLVQSVVRDLNLNIRYLSKYRFGWSDLYTSSPVEFVWIKKKTLLAPQEIQVIIKDNQTFMLKTGEDKFTEMNFKDTLHNDFGSWRLSPAATVAQHEGQLVSISISDLDEVVGQYQKQINAILASKLTTMIVLSINDEVPQRGKDILNKLISNYNFYDKVEKNQETKATLDFIDQRLDSLRSELDYAERGIELFKSNRGLTDISSDSKISLENMQANDERLNEVNVQLAVIEGIEKYIKTTNGSERIPSSLGIGDPTLVSSIEKFAQLNLQRERLLATTPETNPDFDPINRQIAITKATINDQVENIKHALENTKSKLLSYNSKYESSIKEIPLQERQYINIKRHQSTKESLYTYLLQKREETSVRYASMLSNDRVIDQAYSGPANGARKSIFFIVALLFGIGFPLGFVYLRDLLKGKITTIADIQNTSSIPIIGEISMHRPKANIVISSEACSMVSEQFRALRIKLNYLHGQSSNKGRVTLVTSSAPGEGKSFVAANLAMTLAFSGRRTIVLDLDMRKPKIAHMFQLDPSTQGIGNYLDGSAKLSEIRQFVSAKLDVISSGNPAFHNPSDLLEEDSLQDLIEQLRSQYDDIIIDSPPVHLVADAIIFSQLSNITLYVVRQGHTKKAEITFVNELCSKQQLTNTNIVFNGIERQKYGYGYQYNSDYYSAEKTSKVKAIFGDFSNRF